MANWACTDYIIEGPDEILLKITEAIKHPVVTPGSDETWEGNVLNTLGIKWKGRQPDGSGYYMRGFIQDAEDIGFIPVLTSIFHSGQRKHGEQQTSVMHLWKHFLTLRCITAQLKRMMQYMQQMTEKESTLHSSGI